MYFETNPFNNTNDINYIFKSNNEIPFDMHTQSGFEFVCVTEGVLNISIDGIKNEIQKNDACLIFPFQKHEYLPSSGRIFICTFSENLVRHFYISIKEKRPLGNSFRFPAYRLTINREMNIYELKSFLYSICGSYIKQNNSFADTAFSRDSSELLDKILNFIYNNIGSVCTLTEMSKQLKYDYSYLSKFFKNNLKVSFPEYVNGIRVHNACYLLKNSELSVADVASECGYESINTFNKVFKKLMGKTPSDYRSLQIMKMDP